MIDHEGWDPLVIDLDQQGSRQESLRHQHPTQDNEAQPDPDSASTTQERHRQGKQVQQGPDLHHAIIACTHLTDSFHLSSTNTIGLTIIHQEQRISRNCYRRPAPPPYMLRYKPLTLQQGDKLLR